ncbi:DNA cytosine methyltransferase [Ochrobactrum sp. 695/2009]|nr:DNA cytosine methyltransferase [Brucella intermedia]PJR89974.1 DNA cytosine methyltransferase [Ochrobactrum sp. 721/2009]PJT14191.1 DNA cytosine methyltransferase [Ochrobactrum sp. 720/2009]PJT24360.1 DNA cytosine methyltransferase [Ochrobactrum sp. 715/2009]PJT30315.1 DNA cytosine methyltransferase [Ochrobactrum sp. 695/2009]PJT33842.1 DNA cytosine methyltransferase [Ochrobactrum sp. 689/2009]
MTAYYNEFDPKAAAWLRELIKAGHIAPGDVDERSIVDIRPSDLIGYTQCHFFAGIGVWSYALRRAGWPDDRPVWTGSCPCQPFSAAGKGAGFTDERHLWPHFHWLIENCRPSIVFGEQVASKDGLGWLDLVQADLEGSGYASGAVDTCAAGFGAPHIRQRLYWVGKRLEHAEGVGRLERWAEPSGWRADIERGFGIVGDARFAGLEGQRGGHSATFGHGQGSLRPTAATSEFGRLADAESGRQSGQSLRQVSGGSARGNEGDRQSCRMADAGCEQREWGQGSAQRCEYDRQDAGRLESHHGPVGIDEARHGPQSTGPTNGFWRDADWLFCRDGKWRPVEPGTFPLVDGAAARVGRLRGYGNAIVAPAAQAFIEAFLATEIMAANDNHCGVTFRPAA